MIEISIKKQKLKFIKDFEVVKEYQISTSINGIGNEKGSKKTPIGRHCICEKIGEGATMGVVFQERKNTGIISRIYKRREEYPCKEEFPCITTRILRLKGMERGFNASSMEKGIDTFSRCIYIHGTPYEYSIGVPNSKGCIRMRNKDIAELFELVEERESVTIAEDPNEEISKKDRELLCYITEFFNLENDGSTYTERIAIITKIIELEPYNSVHYYNRGVIHGYLSNDKEAIDDYTKAIELNPNDEKAYGNRGVAYSNRKDWDRAIRDIEQSLKINPHSIHSLNLPNMYDFRACSYLQEGNYGQAISDCNYLIGNFPDYYAMDGVKKILKEAERKK